MEDVGKRVDVVMGRVTFNVGRIHGMTSVNGIALGEYDVVYII